MIAIAVATALTTVVKGYLVVGFVFALVYVSVLAQRMDPAAAGASFGFRVVIIPGVTLLWPLLLSRAIRGRKTPVECTAHRAAVVPEDTLVRGDESP